MSRHLKSAFFSALSMSFPVGEQYFIDSVRAGVKALPEADRAGFTKEVAGFVGQEATHRRVHDLFNGHLQAPGSVADERLRGGKRDGPVTHQGKSSVPELQERRHGGFDQMLEERDL